MLDEDEFASFNALYSECLRAAKEFREAHELPLEARSIDERFAPVRRRYPVRPRYKVHIHRLVLQPSASVHHRRRRGPYLVDRPRRRWMVKGNLVGDNRPRRGRAVLSAHRRSLHSGIVCRYS